jgi:hypothetical protein
MSFSRYRGLNEPRVCTFVLSLGDKLCGYSKYLPSDDIDWICEEERSIYKAESILPKLKEILLSYFKDASLHWYFIEGLEAFYNGLYVASSCAILNGIETKLKLLNNPRNPQDALEGTLTRGLVQKLWKKGIPLNDLLLDDYDRTIINKPNPEIKIVKLRNHLNHGNKMDFFQEYEGNKIFVPECLLDINKSLISAIFAWGQALSEKEL